MIKFQPLSISLCVTSLVLGFWVLPMQAQTSNTSVKETVKKVVTLTNPDNTNVNFEIVGSQEQVNNAAVVLANVLGAGIDPSNAKEVIPIVLAGADPVETINLMLNLNGLIPNNTNVDVNKLNKAINAYNNIVDKANTNSLKALSNTPEFINIGDLLQKLRAALS